MYTAPSACTGSARSAGAVVRSQVPLNPEGTEVVAAVSRHRPWFCGHSSSPTSMTTSTGHA